MTELEMDIVDIIDRLRCYGAFIEDRNIRKSYSSAIVELNHLLYDFLIIVAHVNNVEELDFRVRELFFQVLDEGCSRIDTPKIVHNLEGLFERLNELYEIKEELEEPEEKSTFRDMTEKQNEPCLDIASIGISDSQHRTMKLIKGIIERLVFVKLSGDVLWKDIVHEAEMQEIKPKEVKEALDQLKRVGEIYEIGTGRYRQRPI